MLRTRPDRLAYRVLAGAGTLALLAACSAKLVTVENDVPVQTLPPPRTWLDEPTSDELCTVVPLAVVSANIPDVFDESTPGVPAAGLAECTYEAAGNPIDGPKLVLHVTTMATDFETGAVDESFQDPTGNPVAFQEIHGLGTEAGYGPNPHAPGEDATRLAVYVEPDNAHGHWRVELDVEQASASGIFLDQLRPIAEHAISALPR